MLFPRKRLPVGVVLSAASRRGVEVSVGSAGLVVSVVVALLPGVLGGLVAGVLRVGPLNGALVVDVVVVLSLGPRVMLLLVEGAHLCCVGPRDGSRCPCFKGSESP